MKSVSLSPSRNALLVFSFPEATYSKRQKPEPRSVSVSHTLPRELTDNYMMIVTWLAY